MPEDGVSYTIGDVSKGANIQQGSNLNSFHIERAYFDKNQLVSYRVINNNQCEKGELLKQIMDEIDVKLQEDGSAHEQYTKNPQLPFVPFIDFEDLKNEKKIFLMGRSGAGKSRSIIELVKVKLEETIRSIDKVYVINPRGQWKSTSRNSVSDITSRLTVHDLVVWDNFPDDMSLAVSVESGLEALAIISSARAENLIVALNPKLLEKYRINLGSVDDYLTTKEIMYDQNRILHIIEGYGNNTPSLKTLFDKYIEPSLNNVSEILYEKEPSPFAVLSFFKSLKKDYEASPHQIVDIIEYARGFPLSSDYYKRQFEKLLELRPNEADFLYALKVCYDLRLSKTFENISRIQKILLQSEPPTEPIKRLSTLWIYLSAEGLESYYSLHDLPKSVIDYAADRKSRIMHSFCNSISEILEEDIDSQSSIYEAGRSIGENIELLPRGKEKKLLPDNVLSFAGSHEVFFRGFGEGCGSNFLFLNKNFQIAILELANTYREMTDSLDSIVGEQFPNLDVSMQERMLELAERNATFAYYLGGHIAWHFPNLDASIVERMLELAERDKGILMGFCYSISNLESYVLQAVHPSSARGIDTSESTREKLFRLFWQFHKLHVSVVERMLELAERDKEILEYLGRIIAWQFYNIDSSVKERMLELAERDKDVFSSNLGWTVGGYFPKLDASVQQKVLEFAERDKKFADSFSFRRSNPSYRF